MRKNTFIREKSLEGRGCRYKDVEWFEYSEEEQQAVRQARRTRSRASPPKIKKLNDKRSRQYAEWLVQNNFGSGDYHVTLTYDENHVTDKERAKKDFVNYIQRLKRLYRKNGLKLKYFYVYEGRAQGARPHFHLICNGGVSRDEIEERWKCGNVNCDRLRENQKGLAEIARYLTKAMGKTSTCERSWNCSANLKRPDRVVDDNSVSRQGMRKMQEARRNDEVKEIVERIYKGWRLIDYDVGENDVTGRQYVRLKLIRKENRRLSHSGAIRGQFDPP